MNESLQFLHDKFLREVDFNVLYSSFRRLKPFRVVYPTVQNRNTCACILHVNTNILVSKLHELCIFDHKTESDLLKELCCSKDTLIEPEKS